MTHTPTAEEFLAQPGTDEDDVDELPPVQLDPLTSIAASLATIAAAVQEHGVRKRAEDPLLLELGSLEQQRDDLEAKYEALSGLVDDVLEVCKPSVSKLANQVRETVAKWRSGPEAELTVAEQPEPKPEGPVQEPEGGVLPRLPRPPADADVEVWRSYARSHGYAGPDVDKANRSQIRTLLGIPHEAE